MTDKTKIKLDNVIAKFPGEYQPIYREIIDYAVSLGYTAKINKNETYADFIKSKHGKIIMKIECGYKGSQIPRLNLRLDAMHPYEGIFKKALEHRISFCQHCNRCHGSIGIKYVFPNGETGYVCSATIYLPDFSANDIPAVKNALMIQDTFLIQISLDKK